MRRLSIVLFVLAGLAAALAIAFFVYIQGLACAFSNRSGPCSFRMPWDMRGEDFLVIVVVPWGVVLALLAGALAARRAARRR